MTDNMIEENHMFWAPFPEPAVYPLNVLGEYDE